jgi:hypothetical protein
MLSGPPTLTIMPTHNGHANSVDTSVCVDDRHVFNTLVANNGHMKLTCEQLTREYGQPITPVHIIEAVKDRLDDLKAYMETLSVLELFSLMPVLSKTLEANMASLEPSDAVNAFMGLHKLIESKVGITKIDVTQRNEVIWRNVPDELKALWLEQEVGEAS